MKSWLAWGSLALISFSLRAEEPHFLYPLEGDAWVSAEKPFRWIEVPGADVYYLKVGSQPGASDLMDTGEIQQLSFPMTNVPSDMTVYASIYARIEGKWKGSQVSFQRGPGWVYPWNNAVNIDPLRPFEWSSDARVSAWRLEIGDHVERRIFFDSGWMRRNSTRVPRDIPADRRLYARLQFRHADEVHEIFSDFEPSFRVLEPLQMARYEESEDVLLKWTPLGSHYFYRVSLGDFPNHQEIIDWTSTERDQIWVPRESFDHAGRFQVTVLAYEKESGRLIRRADAIFWKGKGGPTMRWLAPQENLREYDPSGGFEWEEFPEALQYRLVLKYGEAIAYDSEWISSTRHLIPVTKEGDYELILSARTPQKILRHSRKLHLNPFTPHSAVYWRMLKAATVRLFEMSGDDFAPYFPRSGTLLFEKILGYDHQLNCLQTSESLQEVIQGMNLQAIVSEGGRPEVFSTAFLTNGFEGHTFVALDDPENEKRIVVDPTFAWWSRGASGSSSGLRDLQEATLNGSWKSVRGEFLISDGISRMKNYYLPYPLLFLNLQPFPNLARDTQDPYPFLEPMEEIAGENRTPWIFSSLQGRSLEPVYIDGEKLLDPILPLPHWNLYRVLYGKQIEVEDPPSDLKIYRVKAFPGPESFEAPTKVHLSRQPTSIRSYPPWHLGMKLE